MTAVQVGTVEVRGLSANQIPEVKFTALPGMILDAPDQWIAMNDESFAAEQGVNFPYYWQGKTPAMTRSVILCYTHWYTLQNGQHCATIQAMKLVDGYPAITHKTINTANANSHESLQIYAFFDEDKPISVTMNYNGTTEPVVGG